MGYLDNAGLQYLWSKLKEKFAAKSHTHDSRYYTESEMDTKLSGKLHEETIASAVDANTLKTTGIYHVKTTAMTNMPTTNHGSLYIDFSIGTPFQLFWPDNKNTAYKRNYSGSTWTAWTQLKFTDTNTWRGIQNNLTSDSTTDSLSAAQGKALKALVDGKASQSHIHLNGTKSGAVDWNTFITFGTYKIQNCTMTDAYHAPAGEYAYGILQILDSENGASEKRIIQIYWPHNTSKGSHFWYRMHNGSDISTGWNAWTAITKKPATAGTADTAKKLSTSAGSSTQPVYFKDGIPVATTYSLNKTVPADAKFTDTWRGVQNNLTSTATDQSLSAAQGRILKDLVDGKLGKNDKAASAATADKATKLATTRTVSGGSDITLNFSYDGSANSNASIGFYSCNHTVQNTNNYPFHRFAKLDASTAVWADKSMTFLINQDYFDGGYGICRLVYRSNADSSNVLLSAEWLVRKGLSADSIQVAIKADKTNGAYCDAFYKSPGTYMSVVIRSLASGGRGSQGRTWTLIGSGEAAGTTTTSKGNSSECWKTIAEAGTALHNQAYSATVSAIDSGVVSSAASCSGNAATATVASKVGTATIGSATKPVYINNGVPTAGTYTLGAACAKNIRSLSSVGAAGWTNQSVDDALVPTMAFMAFWNGAYGGTASNLQYCNRGRFGTIVTKGSGDYLPIGGGTLTGNLRFSDIGDTNTSNKITWQGSTDGADIYYQTTAADQGNLVLNLRDDSNCYLRIASNGVFKSYFTPDDGNFHGNVNGNVSGSSGSCTGNSATATTAAKLGRGGNTGVPMTFNWSGQSGQPSWLWGGNDGTNMYVYNPSNFSVNYATTAGNGVESSGTGYIRFKCGVQICWGWSGAVTTSYGTNTFNASFNNTTYGVTMNAFNKKVDYGITITSKATTSFSWGKNGAAPNGYVWVAVGTWK